MNRQRSTVLLIATLFAACSPSGAGITPVPIRTPMPTLALTPTPSPTQTVVATPEAAGLVLVAMGDSIAFNAPNDCLACTGYVEQYGSAIAAATGKPVRVVNLSEHSGLTSDGLIRDLSDAAFRAKVAGADAITISIGFNDSPMLVSDDPCDGPIEDTQLATYTEACIAVWAKSFGQRLTNILDQVRDLRGDKPTLITVINIFDQWLGFSENSPSVAANIAVVKTVLERQNSQICAIAIAHGALCADLHSAFNGPLHDKPSGALLGQDYAHPSQAGNDLIAKTLTQLGFGPLN